MVFNPSYPLIHIINSGVYTFCLNILKLLLPLKLLLFMVPLIVPTGDSIIVVIIFIKLSLVGLFLMNLNY
jgi:hypothetical protein